MRRRGRRIIFNATDTSDHVRIERLDRGSAGRICRNNGTDDGSNLSPPDNAADDDSDIDPDSGGLAFRSPHCCANVSTDAAADCDDVSGPDSDGAADRDSDPDARANAGPDAVTYPGPDADAVALSDADPNRNRSDRHYGVPAMRRHAAAIATLLALAGCGGGTAPNVKALTTTTSMQSGTASISIRVPLAQHAATTAGKRAPAYVSAATAEFFVDLQGGPPGFDATLPVNATNCVYADELGWEVCNYSISLPVGTDTLSIASVGPGAIPVLLGYGQVTTTVAAGVNATVAASLSAVVTVNAANNNFPLAYGYGEPNDNPPFPAYVPYIGNNLQDGYNDLLPISPDLFQPVTLYNQVYYSVNAASDIQLGLLYYCGCATFDAIVGTVAQQVQVTSIAGLMGVEIVDGIPSGGAAQSFPVSVSATKVTVSATEFPQITTFLGAPTTMTGGGGTESISLYCTAPGPVASVSPCSVVPPV